jgi:serine/threonine protein kinase
MFSVSVWQKKVTNYKATNITHFDCFCNLVKRIAIKRLKVSTDWNAIETIAPQSKKYFAKLSLVVQYLRDAFSRPADCLMKIPPGKILQNRYLVQKLIGQGGMGAIFIATDRRFDSTVAIKQTFYSDANMQKAFEREARLLNSLRHPALPRVSDHFFEDDGQFLVMEYIAGNDLMEMMEKRGKAFPFQDVLGWTDQLLDALDYLHTRAMPVIHRDIKPQNLKLMPSGQIILLDFGLAKGNPNDPSSVTSAKSVFGYSPVYASLEQMQGTGTDPRSDIYSLGATIFHLVTGKMPTASLTRAACVINDEKDPLPLFHELRPEIPVNISGILSQAMALNANQRPKSAAEMRAALKNALNSIETPAILAAKEGKTAEVEAFKTNVNENPKPQTEIINLGIEAIVSQPKLTGNVYVKNTAGNKTNIVSKPLAVKRSELNKTSIPPRPKNERFSKPLGDENSGSNTVWKVLAVVAVLMAGISVWYSSFVQIPFMTTLPEGAITTFPVVIQGPTTQEIVPVQNGETVVYRETTSTSQQSSTTNGININQANKPQTIAIDNANKSANANTISQTNTSGANNLPTTTSPNANQTTNRELEEMRQRAIKQIQEQMQQQQTQQPQPTEEQVQIIELDDN